MDPGIRRLAYNLFGLEIEPHRFQVATVANHHIKQDNAARFAANPVNLGLERVPAMVAYKHVHGKNLSKECATAAPFFCPDFGLCVHLRLDFEMFETNSFQC
jgi:hypothetical protein